MKNNHSGIQFERPVTSMTGKRTVDPSTLRKQQRQTLWKGIQKTDPALADLLTNDPVVAELKAAFNGVTVFEVDDFNRFIQAGQEIE